MNIPFISELHVMLASFVVNQYHSCPPYPSVLSIAVKHVSKEALASTYMWPCADAVFSNFVPYDCTGLNIKSHPAL